MATKTWTRRGVMGVFAAALATRALAKTPNFQGASSSEVVAKAKLGGTTGFCLVDVATAEILDSLNPSASVPPASVLKTITTLYALERLGADHSFTTQVLATQPVNAGTLEGDLILSGGGDPTLNTDSLGEMLAALARSGLRRVSGRFLVYAGALPTLDRIAADHGFDEVSHTLEIFGRCATCRST